MPHAQPEPLAPSEDTVTEPNPTPPPGARRRAHPALVAAVAVAAVAASIGGFFAWKFASLERGIRLDPAQERAVEAALDPAPKPAPKTAANEVPAAVQYILLLGVDMRPGETRGRSDTILVARVDPATRHVSMLSIPRDTRVDVPGHGKTKINAAMAYGGPALAIRTVKEFTGLPVNHFVTIDFRGFADVVDTMGGVRLDVDRAIDDKNGATTGGISTVTRIDAGPQRLDGEQALTYVRSRKYADGDFTRIRHQQALLAAVAEQALTGPNVDKLPAMVGVLGENIKTDMSVVEMSQLASLLKDMTGKDVKTAMLPGTPRRLSGVSYVIPDLAARDRLVASFERGLPAEAR